jgi:hypothetical protein
MAAAIPQQRINSHVPALAPMAALGAQHAVELHAHLLGGAPALGVGGKNGREDVLHVGRGEGSDE